MVAAALRPGGEQTVMQLAGRTAVARIVLLSHRRWRGAREEEGAPRRTVPRSRPFWPKRRWASGLNPEATA